MQGSACHAHEVLLWDFKASEACPCLPHWHHCIHISPGIVVSDVGFRRAACITARAEPCRLCVREAVCASVNNYVCGSVSIVPQHPNKLHGDMAYNVELAAAMPPVKVLYT